MSWIPQLVEESGISQFLGEEAKDEDIRSFFIESVTSAVDGSLSSSAKEIALVANSVKDFLSDYDIQLKDAKKLETVCKTLIDKYLEKKAEQSKKQPQKVKETKKPAGKKKGGKKKNQDDDDDEFSGSKSKAVEDEEKTPLNQSNGKNTKQQKGKPAASLLLLADENDEGEDDAEEEVAVKGKKKDNKKNKVEQAPNDQKSKTGKQAAKPTEDDEDEQSPSIPSKQTKGKQKGKQKVDEEDKSKTKTSGKGKQKQVDVDDAESEETVEPQPQPKQGKSAAKKKDRRRGKEPEEIEEQPEPEEAEPEDTLDEHKNGEQEETPEEPIAQPPQILEKQITAEIPAAQPAQAIAVVENTEAISKKSSENNDSTEMPKTSTESQTSESQIDAEKQPSEEKLTRKEKKKLAKQQANNNNSAPQDLGLETNLGSDSTSKDIKIEKFDISVPGKVLFQNATLALSHGRKYGLVGPNGQGKSTLLKYISMRANEFRDIPKHFDIHYVEQEVVGDESSALECVIAADIERLNLLAEEKKLMDSDNDDDATGERLSQIHARLDEIEAHSAEGRASAILSGLQFTEDMKKKATKDFSGGWRMRISLARALFRRPTLLLLDEPTNHLDLLAVIWLETYLLKWKNTLLVVSHDQDFLNSICTDMIHVYQQKLNYYKGNYDKFKYQFNEYVTQMKKAHEKHKKLMEEERKRMQNLKKSTKSNDNVKDSTRVLRNKDLKKQADHRKHQKDEDDTKKELTPLPKDYNVIFEFPDPDPLSIPVIQVDDASFGYTPDNLIFKDLNFGIDMDSRIALVGPNGAGKSTLLKLLTGELQPTAGSVQRNRKLIIGRFTQHFVDTLNMDQTAIEYLNTKFPEYQPQELRGMLGRFGLSGQTHLQKIGSLSGGQKSRVVFTEICMKNPHLLFLDEPTNHLDIESVDALAEALNEFKGGIVLVSHDARLISEVCGSLWVVGDNTVNIYDGAFADYRDELVEEFEEQEREEEERKKQREEEKRKQREEQMKIRQEHILRRQNKN